MEKRSDKLVLRWTTLIVIIINTVFSYLYLPFVLQSTGQAYNGYHNYLAPAEYGLGMGMLIPISFLIYGIHQLRVPQRTRILYDRLTGPIIFTSVFSIFRIVLYNQDAPGLKALTLLVMAINAMVMLQLVRSRILDCSYSPWLTIPFSLNAGFLTTAVFADISMWLRETGWYNGAPGEPVWTVLMILASFVVAISISVKYRDWIFSMVVTYAIISVWWAKPDNVAVTAVSLFSGALLAIWSAGYAAYLIREQIRNTGGAEEIENI